MVTIDTATHSLMAIARATTGSGVDLRADSYGTFNTVGIREDERWMANVDGSYRPSSPSGKIPSKAFTKRVVMLVVALDIFTYHAMTYDHLLPIFLQDERIDGTTTIARSLSMIPRGLALTTQMLLSSQFFQTGLESGMFLMVTILQPTAYFIVPYLTLLPDSMVFSGIYACLTVRDLFSIFAYPVTLIFLKEATLSAAVLGKVNGLAASVGAACSTVAPPVAGFLYSTGMRQGFNGLARWVSGLVAIVGPVQICWIEREKNKTASVRSVALCLIPNEAQTPRKGVVYIVVEGE